MGPNLKGCDLIVMASHGRSGLSAVVLGSVTVKVLTHGKDSGSGLSLNFVTSRSCLLLAHSGPWVQVHLTARGSEVLSAARVPLINAIVARLIYINGVSRGRSSFFTEAGCEVPAMKMSSVLA